VLQEAKDPNVPLLERVKFLAIYSNNLDEFFRVRVAGNRQLIRLTEKTKKELDYNPEEIQKSIIEIVNSQQVEFSRIFFDNTIPELNKIGIKLLMPGELNDEQEEFIKNYFYNYMLPFVQPVLLVKNKIKPFLNNGSLYLAIHLKDKNRKKPRSEYAIVKIPSDHLPRFTILPSKNSDKNIVILDDIVRMRIQHFFPGYDIKESFSIKLTRDAGLYIEDEFTGDLLEKIKNGLQKRYVGTASRLVYDRKMPKRMLKFFTDTLEISEFDLFKEGRYHNNFDFFSFPGFKKEHLKNLKLTPLTYPDLEEADDIFEAIKQRDHLLHMPYHSYESVIRFFEDAARDPKVTHIKIVQYRVAKKSRIMDALIRAAKAGKNVSVFVEVKARFDEEANLRWGEKLEKQGINVHYSFPGLKVHSKIALVRRREGRYVKLYAYMGTGNFHEGTVKIYSDLGLFTYDKRLTDEVIQVFSILENIKIPKKSFNHLLVGQFNLRPKLEELVQYEMEEARKGNKAEIFLKMNSLQDPKMIKLLYDANKAGVNIRMIIRGICCLVPGIKGISNQIKTISIVDRYLEHSRVFYFHHGGDELMYLSSVDWMRSKLSERIETVFPIYDKDIHNEIMDFLDIQWNDNTKARHIHIKKNNLYKRDSQVMAYQAQIETYHYYKRKIDTLAK
jgi:polyphosphate kinase